MSNFSDYISAGVTRYGDWGRVVRRIIQLELDHGDLIEHFELAPAMHMLAVAPEVQPVNSTEDWWFLTGITHKAT